MDAMFYVSGAVAILATALAISRSRAVEALLYLVVSLFASALVIYALGAPFAAALEVIVYAGAIVVLFVFVVLLIGQEPHQVAEERTSIRPGAWLGPTILAAVLLGQLVGVSLAVEGEPTRVIGPKEVGIAMYGPYLLAVEAASLLLLAAVVGAWHVGRPERLRPTPSASTPGAPSALVRPPEAP